MDRQARVYDFDPDYHVHDGEDNLGVYVLREVERIIDGIAILRNGENSHTFKFCEAEDEKT